MTTLRSPRGIGLLYLSAARHARGRQDSFGGADFLSRFLRSLGLEVEESDIALSPGLGCRIYTYVRETESRALDLLVRHRRRDRAAPVLLPAASADRGRESEEVEEIVRSARLYHSAPVH